MGGFLSLLVFLDHPVPAVAAFVYDRGGAALLEVFEHVKLVPEQVHL